MIFCTIGARAARQLKILTVEDEFTRESLAIEVDYRIHGPGRLLRDSPGPGGSR